MKVTRRLFHDVSLEGYFMTFLFRLASFNNVIVKATNAKVVAIVTSSLIFSAILKLDNSTVQQNRHLLTLVNFTSFAAHFGAQIWVTLFAGIIMILNIPRFWFGQLQARIFPIFFCYGTIMSSVTLSTFLVLHPQANSTHNKMVSGLVVCIATSLVNLCFLSSLIVSLMTERFELERDSGLAMKIGFPDMSPLDENDEYQKVNRKFRFLHKLNGVTNVLGLIGKIVYLYYLAQLVVVK